MPKLTSHFISWYTSAGFIPLRTVRFDLCNIAGSSARSLYFSGTSRLITNCSDMEPSTIQYRTFAKECRRLAELAKTAKERQILHEMETRWTKLAEEMEVESRSDER